MKKIRLIVLIVISGFFLSGCAVGRGLGNGWNDFMDVSYTLPSPQAGLVFPVHRSPAVWAWSFLFRGDLREDDLMVPCRNGSGLAFSQKPLADFMIKPPINKARGSVFADYTTVPLQLPSRRAKYTLLVFYQNFRDRIESKITKDGRLFIKARKMKVHRFSTAGRIREYRIGNTIIYADRVIRLSSVRPYERSQFILHVTLYPGHALKGIVGLPE